MNPTAAHRGGVKGSAARLSALWIRHAEPLLVRSSRMVAGEIPVQVEASGVCHNEREAHTAHCGGPSTDAES